MTPASPHAVIFVIVTVFIDMMGFGLIMPVLPALIEEVGHVSLARASVIGGWMFFAFALAQFLFSPLMGNLSDRFGRRPLRSPAPTLADILALDAPTERGRGRGLGRSCDRLEPGAPPCRRPARRPACPRPAR